MKEKVSEYFGHFRKEDLSSWRQFFHSTFFGWILFFAFVVVLTLLMSVVVDSLPSQVVKGTIAPKDIWANKDYEIVDTEATEGLRQEARQTVLPQYVYNDVVSENVQNKISKVFKDSRVQLRPLIDISGKLRLTPEGVASLKEAFGGGLGIEMDDEAFKAFVNNRFSRRLESVVKRWTSEVYEYRIVEDKKALQDFKKKGIVVSKKEGEKKGVLFKDWSRIRDLKESRAEVGKDPIVKNTYRPSTYNALIKVTQALIQSDLSYDEDKTKELQGQAADKVIDVTISLKDGESIIRKGARYDDHTIKVIGGIVKTKAKAQYYIKFMGVSIFLAAFFFILYSFGHRFIPRFHPTKNDLIFFGAWGIATVGLTRLFLVMLPAFHRLISDVPIHAFYYLIPIAASAMLVRLISNAETTTLFIVALMGIVGFMFQGNVGLLIFYMTSSFFGALIMTHVSSRFDIFRAGLYTGLVNVFLVLTLDLIYSVTTIGDFVLGETFWKIGFGFLGGVFASFVVMIFTPIVEAVFNYLTDIKLLEYGSLNHPLLRELIVRAPGTYHHSHMVGTLSEAACNAIGANGLFARVACYFHDVGKMKKPEYFIENQRGDNKHERLSPSMSALIIASHVKDGIELAHQYKLPQKIVDIIPQHQGKKQIIFFYAKAKEMEKTNAYPVKEETYRYAGPKPQTREAGVILLADTVEAATRSLKDRSPAKLKSVVQNMINKNFADGQLDECEMTLRDLHVIAEQFTRILVAIYHQRVEYPDFEHGDEKKTAIQSGDKYYQQEPIQNDFSVEDPEPYADNIRRLRPS